MTSAAPIVRIALAFAAGVSAGLAGAPLWSAPLGGGLLLVAPERAWSRPGERLLVALVVAAGVLAGGATRVDDARCTVTPTGASAPLFGRFLASPRHGAAPFERMDGCGPYTVVVGDAATGTPAGRPVRVEGVWREGRVRPWMQARRVDVAPAGRDRPGVVASVSALRWLSVRWRDHLVARAHRLFGDNGPMVAALVLARREGLDPDTRGAFADSGIAHLLAISGFHVGLVAGLVFSLLRARSVSRRRAAGGAAIVSWVYVAFIGFPAAACRAALILTAAAGARSRGHPASRWGPLAAAGFVLLLVQPELIGSAGFQLSFAGAAGLVAWSRPLRAVLVRAMARGVARGLEAIAAGRLVAGPVVPGLSAGLASAVAAGCAATLATLPFVAWHFERVSLVGIPVTLLATPLVVLALPGAIASLALDFVSPDGASFLAGGVSVLLDLLTRLSTGAAGLPWATATVERPTVLAVCAGAGLAVLHARAPRIGGAARRRLTVAYALIAVLSWPLLVGLGGRGRLELLMIDVGQGDAIALRSPAGRWWLVDTGREPRADPADHPVVRTLRRRGVRRLDALVLTHPDGDHTGGARAVLDHVRPDRVIDPMVPTWKPGYVTLLEHARASGVPWRRARAGDRYDVDGVTIEVLHPGTDAGGEEANALSVVLLVSWGGFRALLTGDAYVDVERAIMTEVGDIDVLKVGHHGSETSSDSSFLAAIRPEIALVSAGRGNRYGHPAPEVLRRLHEAGAVVERTDLSGTIGVVVGRDGRYRIRRAR